MSLVKCPECGKENVSDSALACPECGFNLREHFLKEKEKSKEYHVKYCPRCAIEKTKQPYHTRFYIPGYINFLKTDESKYCGIHDGEKIPYRYLNITNKEFHALCVINSSAEYIEKMNQLKIDNPEQYQEAIEYGFKKEAEEQSNIPKCPTCGSTNLSKISGMKKAAKVGFFGIFGAGDLGKTWKCNNCGSKF